MDEGIHNVEAVDPRVAVAELAQLQQAMVQGQGDLARFVRDFQRSAASLHSEWHRAVDDMLQETARLLGGLGGLSGMGEVFGSLGQLAGWADRQGRSHRLTLTRPDIPLPPGAILPGTLEGLAARTAPPVGVTVAEGAVQIATQRVDDDAVARLAETLAEQVQARLAMEDQRQGRL